LDDDRAGLIRGETTSVLPRAAVVALALTTAAIHIGLAIPMGLVGFYLNGLGYLTMTAALSWPGLRRFRSRIRWLFMGYTALTIVLWALLGSPYTPIGFLDKAVELGLLAALWLDRRND
jgi:hypothetical protein